jgi:hypothetical protein
LLELFDGDGAFWLDAAGGTFAGSPQGCDSNLDTQIDAADMICTVLIIFQGQGACSVATAEQSASLVQSVPAALAIPDALFAELGEKVAVPINFASNGNDIAATAFVLTFDTARLHFDPTDGNGDGIPDAVSLHVPQRYAKSVSVDGQGRIQIALSDIALPLLALADGPLATITFTAGESADGETTPVAFADDYPVSVGSTSGASLPVSVESGSVLIEGTELTGEIPQPNLPEPEIPEPQVPQQPQKYIFLPLIPK